MTNIAPDSRRQPHGSIGILFLVSLILFILTTWAVFVRQTTILDDHVFEWISPLTSDPMTAFMKVVTYMGNYEFLAPANLLLIGFLIWKKQKRAAWRVAVIALSSLGMKLALKELFQRLRPTDPMLQGITNFSYPSGHAFMSVSFYGLLIWLTWTHVRDNKLRLILTLLFGIMIFLIGFSRIYLRVHYTTDVVAGFCLGICWVSLLLYFTRKIEK
jgi:membrane-associated phospholipid phosphatase